MKILKECFGQLKSGEEVLEYSMINENGFKVKILNYGGIIRAMLAPNKHGQFENIVLGFDHIRDYEEKSPYFGAIVGRVAGRISNASFKIDNNTYKLVKNNGKHHIHGGNKGFDKVIWKVEEIIQKNHIRLKMGYLSCDGEEGFPGNLSVEVTYTLNNQDELEIRYSAVSDQKTIINLTNHTYFNLSGNLKEDILNHKLMINADQVAFVDKETIPTGEFVDVEKGVFDFRQGKKVGTDMKKEEVQLIHCGGYDHPWILNKDHAFQVKLEDENSGRSMEVTTDRPIVVCYAGNQIGEDLILSGNRKSEKNLGICLETQDYPDAINQDHFPTKIYRPAEAYEAYTKYKFHIK
ncbi:aldose epimerase family protein [Marinisporobacter balticus]|uniref:Aldose 1-epimerase n=1 Tax=Marinisporobacter balticus TaxID=2018667 RepID=A0A4R2KN78_9FIRM|nr:aldose epimerase family protein [Marinisporobacter balticus]TCO72256.1 aldose 1-epimerase [Marinisporobacter balticus]